MLHPSLISTAELAEILGTPQLRIFDTYVDLAPKPGGGYDVKSGREAYLRQHIPGAAFIDVLSELSDPNHRLRFMMPPDNLFLSRMSSYGVDPSSNVVLYNRGATWWATRVFFMLRAHGFDRVRVLDGGLDKWLLESRPTQRGTEVYPPAKFQSGVRRPIFVDKAFVLRAVNDRSQRLVNALSPEIFSGKVLGYGRPGRIAGSCNVYAKHLLDGKTQAFLPLPQLRKILADAGLLDGKPVITYCGGGISATTDAFALWMLGVEDVTIYDASMNEWGPDETLPMETGPTETG